MGFSTDTGRSILKLTREFYIPANYLDKIVECNGAIEIYTQEYGNGFAATGWQGKAVKPSFNYSFGTAERMNAYIEKFIENYKAKLKMKAEAKAAAKAKRAELAASIKAGDIYYTSWGYDQTNVDFYKVIEVKGQKVTLIEIGSKIVDNNGSSDSVVANPEAEKGEPFNKMVSKYGTFNIASYASASKWDGAPKHATAWGYGH